MKQPGIKVPPWSRGMGIPYGPEQILNRAEGSNRASRDPEAGGSGPGAREQGPAWCRGCSQGAAPGWNVGPQRNEKDMGQNGPLQDIDPRK